MSTLAAHDQLCTASVVSGQLVEILKHFALVAGVLVVLLEISLLKERKPQDFIIPRNFQWLLGYVNIMATRIFFFSSAMVSCRYWYMGETVGMRKRSVFKIGGCVHSLIVLGFVGRCFHTFLSLKHFPTRIYWSIASIAAWGHLLFFYLHRTLLRN